MGDVFRSGSSNDGLNGGGGADVLEGGGGGDSLTGGTGNDTASYENSLSAITLDFSDRSFDRGDAVGDTFDSIETYRGTRFDDTFVNNGFNDGIARTFEGGAGADTFLALDFVTTVSYEHSAQGVTVDLNFGTQTSEGDAAGDVILGINGLIGSGLADTLTGNDVNNVLRGGDDIDTLDGQGGADRLFGQSGDDDLTGGEGSDRLDGGTGADDMTGGSGDDTFFVDSVSDAVHDTGAGTDTVFASANFFLGQGEQIEFLRVVDRPNGFQIFANDVANTIVGASKDDALNGGGDADRLFGQAGSDILRGGTGNDRLDGGADNDALEGGSGLDQLFGGAGADTFRFLALSDSTVASTGRDAINDFSGTGAQGDKIDLTSLDAISSTAADDGFTFIGAGAFTKQAGQLHYKAAGANTLLVEGDVNGDAKADFQITVRGLSSLDAGDFVL